jgi:hypothetical protein
MLTESLRIRTAIYVLAGMDGCPLKAPWMASITEMEFFFTEEIYPRMQQKILAPTNFIHLLHLNEMHSNDTNAVFENHKNVADSSEYAI